MHLRVIPVFENGNERHAQAESMFSERCMNTGIGQLWREKNVRNTGALMGEDVVWLSVSCYECCATETSEPVDIG